MIENLKIKKLEPNDGAAVANLHHKAFKNFFLTSLGIGFLKTFYEGVLKNPDGVGVGIFNDEDLIGFAIGTKNNKGFYKSIIKSRGFMMLLKALPNLILNPLKVKRLIASLLGSKDLKYAESPCLLSICVSPTTDFKGVGSTIISEFERILVLYNCLELTLTTDKHNNDYVNQFYQRNNYICVHSFFHGKREMNLFYKKL